MIDIRLVIFDIDGVLTDGKAVYDDMGKVISKTYNLYCPKANKEFGQLLKKYEKNFRVDAVQRQYAKGFEIVSYLVEGK